MRKKQSVSRKDEQHEPLPGQIEPRIDKQGPPVRQEEPKLGESGLSAGLSGAQEAIRAEQQRFNDLLEMLPAYLVLLTPDHHIAFANRFFRERFGEDHGRRCFEYLFQRTEPCEVCNTYQVLETGEPQRWEWTGPDGRTYDIYDFPFTDVDGSPLIMEMGIDITQRKRMEEALKEANQTLEQRVAERTAALEEANGQLQAQAEELRVANEELQSQAQDLRAANEELQAQQEELHAQTEELRASEESLRESEQRHRSLFENMLDGYAYCQMVFDSGGHPADFIYLSVNDAFTRLTGLHSVVGKKVTEVIPTLRTSHPELLETYGRVARTGKPERFELEFKPLGAWFSISVYSSRQGYFTTVFDNITERKRAQEAVAHLAAIVQFSDDAIISKDLHGIIQTWNAGAQRLLGYRPEEIIGEPVARLLPPERSKEEDEILERLRRGEYVEHFETVRMARDGRHVDVSATISPLRDADGNLIGASKILRDITERKRAEKSLRDANEQLQSQKEELQVQSEELQTQTEELQTQTQELAAANEELRESRQALSESENRFRTLVLNVSSGVALIDENGKFALYNPAFLTMFGLAENSSVRDVNDQKWGDWQVFEPDGTLLPVDEHPVRKAARTGVAVRNKLVGVRLPAGGALRWMLLSAEPIPGADGRRAIICTYYDVTERKQAEETLQDLNVVLEGKVAQRTAQLEQRARQLQRLTLELSQAEDRERKRMADILHDDLQQQLAAAKFHLSLLNSRARHDPQQLAVVAHVDEMLREAVEKSRSLSHDLSPAVLYQGDLGQTFDWLARQMQTRHGLVVQVLARGEVALQADALKAFLYKAGQELLFNVVKHARVNAVTLRLRRFGRYVGLSVRDQGRGFDPQRLRQTTGFGLFGIRERVELLGGHMKIKSTPGQGSTFTIVVPDREGVVGSRTSVVSEKEASVEPRPPTTGNRLPLRVLLADDHEIVRQGLKTILAEETDVAVVGEAANGREAVDLTARLQPDVVIMDVSMPLISGDQATRQIKMHWPQVRVIGLSMYREPETVERMHRAGAEAYVLKTAPSGELLAAIRGGRRI